MRSGSLTLLLLQWHGGFFERLVGTVKVPLRKVLGKALVKTRELEVLLAEIEAVVNARPLTHVAGTDSEIPLTPAMLLGGTWSDLVSAVGGRASYFHKLERKISLHWSTGCSS